MALHVHGRFMHDPATCGCPLVDFPEQVIPGQASILDAIAEHEAEDAVRPPLDDPGAVVLAEHARFLAGRPARTVRAQDCPFGEDTGPYESGRVLVNLERAGVVGRADQKGRRPVLLGPDDAARAVRTWWLEQR